MKKKIAILGLGLIMATVMLGLGSVQGSAVDPGACVILNNRGHCPFPQTGQVCWVDPGNEQADCNFCCNGQRSPCNNVGVVIDKYGCGCCCLP